MQPHSLAGPEGAVGCSPRHPWPLPRAYALALGGLSPLGRALLTAGPRLAIDRTNVGRPCLPDAPALPWQQPYDRLCGQRPPGPQGALALRACSAACRTAQPFALWVRAWPRPLGSVAIAGTMASRTRWMRTRTSPLSLLRGRRLWHRGPPVARHAPQDMDWTPGLPCSYSPGHGIEVDGTNYLIPVDAKLARDIDVEDETVSLDRVLRVIEPARRLRLVILDACRDNPFVKAMKRAVATRSIGRGLARVEPAVANTLIAFAAKAGSVAEDGTSRNSPFTAALVKHIAEPGLDLRIAFGRVRDEVLASTANRQEPFVYGSLGGMTASIVAPAHERQPEAGAPPAPASANPDTNVRQDYELAERIGSIAAWDAFLTRHPSGFYADLARAQHGKLVALEPKPPVPVGSTSTTSAPTPAAPLPPVRINPAAAPTIKWKVQSGFPSHWQTGLPDLTRRLGELSGGRMSIEPLADGAVVPALQMLDAVHDGRLDAGYVSGGYAFGKDKAFAFMATIPFGFTPRGHLGFR